jgi:NhaP-type Na+/H+ or K+/H+ antiporter
METTQSDEADTGSVSDRTLVAALVTVTVLAAIAGVGGMATSSLALVLTTAALLILALGIFIGYFARMLIRCIRSISH